MQNRGKPKIPAIGELAEWSNAAVLKTASPKGLGGSNPSLSASAVAMPNDSSSESLTTVLVALAANALLGAAKTAAAIFTGSASMLAEAAHSWADTGNEMFLLVAEGKSKRPPAPPP